MENIPIHIVGILILSHIIPRYEFPDWRGFAIIISGNILYATIFAISKVLTTNLF